jgi:hypothetical protein
MTRTHQKHCRVYMDGVDLSGYSRTIGALSSMFGADADASLVDECKNITMGQGEITAGPINAFLDNDAAGLFVLAGSGTADHGTRNLMIAIGSNAAPVAGNPVFAWKFEQTSYQVEQGSGFVAANVTPGGASFASTLTYKQPWGVLLHAKGAETAVNSGTGIDDLGAASALGGIFVYHVFTANGTATFKAQDATTNSNGSFADITGATSGSVDATSAPKHGMIALGTTAAVRRYLRWQIVLGTATTVTFAAAFIRNYVP